MVGDRIILRNTEGPNSFGYILKVDVVSWSGADSEDLLISRCWEGVFLMTSDWIEAEQYEAAELKLCGSPMVPTLAFLADWNRDGRDDLIVTDRWGFLYYFERCGEYPDLTFEYRDIMKSRESGLVFNLPFDNPNHFTGDLGGYIEPYFYNYSYPCPYPWGDDTSKMHLITGDWAGNLWWMEDMSDGTGLPEYRSVPYDKDVSAIRTKQGLDTLAKYGATYLKPPDKICGEDGKPLLLGEGYDNPVHYAGANVHPCLYFNEVTQSHDLIVTVGTENFRTYYLRQINPPGSARPAFRVEGELKVDGIDLNTLLGHHTYPAVWRHEGRNDLLISVVSLIGVLQNKMSGASIPEFEWKGYLRGKDTVSCGNIYTDILTDDAGKRYLLDSDMSGWVLYPIIKRGDGEIRIDPAGVRLFDHNGVFRVKGITDPNLGEAWGVHTAVRWDYDRSGRQHLIVGTDTGHLYLLIDEGGAGKDGKFIYRSFGPLKDETGEAIVIHNRACPAPIDLDGDGFDDLLVSGASYQCGIPLDPEPGGDIYVLYFKGIDASGLPILTRREPLRIEGLEYAKGLNRHILVMTYDLLGDGRREIIISSGFDSPCHVWRVFTIDPDRRCAVCTGKTIPKLGFDDRMLDIDGDGLPEAVMAGDEPRVGNYRRLDLKGII